MAKILIFGQMLRRHLVLEVSGISGRGCLSRCALILSIKNTSFHRYLHRAFSKSPVVGLARWIAELRGTRQSIVVDVRIRVLGVISGNGAGLPGEPEQLLLWSTCFDMQVHRWRPLDPRRVLLQGCLLRQHLLLISLTTLYVL